jgi:glucose-1-phosphate cytidylyltransferase
MEVVILCGGLGTRLKEETEFKPKPMVEVGGMPILWHIMKTYVHYGFKKFVLCLGYRGDVIKNYFYNYEIRSNDFTLTLGEGNIKIHNQHSEQGWEITFAETGALNMTGSRVRQIEKYLTGDTFMLTYGDGVSDVNVKDLLAYHKSHGRIGTVTGVLPPSRFGELNIEGKFVTSFAEKPQVHDGGLINGGYFVFNRKFFDYLDEDPGCILERRPLEKLAADKELCVFEHRQFWQCMDTFRDSEYLNGLWRDGKAEWKVW